MATRRGPLSGGRNNRQREQGRGFLRHAPTGPGEEAHSQSQAAQNQPQRRRQTEEIKGRRRTRPHRAPRAERVEAKRARDDGGSGKKDADEINFQSGRSGGRLELETEQDDGGRQHREHPEGKPPTHKSFERADHKESKRPRHRPGRPEPAHGLALLPSAIVVGDQDHQRRHHGCPGQTGESLGGQHHRGGGADRHEDHRREKERRRRLKKKPRAETLTQLRSQQDESRHAERVHDDRGAHGGGRGLEARHHATHGDGQRGGVER